MINRLVVNGCSYMNVYASGNGHKDLAERLSIPHSMSLAQSGCNNSRILRTTLKDSYTTDTPTLYVLGLTFISRYELPILCYSIDEHADTSFEGRWTNPQNQLYVKRWEHFWTEKDTDLFVKLSEKAALYSVLDYTEDLMYRMLATITDLKSRGHRVLMYQQADVGYHYHLDSNRLQLFKSTPNIMDGFSWCSIIWQHKQGVPANAGDYINKYGTTPEDMRHRRAGHHQILNEYLTNYINQHKILEYVT